MKIKMKTQKIHTMKNTSNNQGLQFENIMLEDIYLTRIFRQLDYLLLGVV